MTEHGNNVGTQFRFSPESYERVTTKGIADGNAMVKDMEQFHVIKRSHVGTSLLNTSVIHHLQQQQQICLNRRANSMIKHQLNAAQQIPFTNLPPLRRTPSSCLGDCCCWLCCGLCCWFISQ